MKFLDPDTESAVRVFLGRLPVDLRLEYAILYGSRARGEDRPDSDADLALILAEGEADWDLVGDLAELACDVYLERGILVQPVPISLRHWLNPERIPKARFPAQCRTRRDRPLTVPPLTRDLRLKAERALATARELQERDPDGSVNRSYYAMFDISRAALLSAGVREDELPRTHSGLIGSFSKHAVLSGRIDQKLFAAHWPH